LLNEEYKSDAIDDHPPIRNNSDSDSNVGLSMRIRENHAFLNDSFEQRIQNKPIIQFSKHDFPSHANRESDSTANVPMVADLKHSCPGCCTDCGPQIEFKRHSNKQFQGIVLKRNFSSDAIAPILLFEAVKGIWREAPIAP
jgi:hypothetical protein